MKPKREVRECWAIWDPRDRRYVSNYAYTLMGTHKFFFRSEGSAADGCREWQVPVRVVVTVEPVEKKP